MGDGALHSMHFWFAGADFWMARSCALASSTGMSAAIARRHKRSVKGSEDVG